MKERRMRSLTACNVLLLLCQLLPCAEACLVCSTRLLSLPHDSFAPWVTFPVTQKGKIETKTKTLVLAPAALHPSRDYSNIARHKHFSKSEHALSRNDDNNDETSKQNEKNPTEKDVTSTAMISSIMIYKNFISPLLPPACRFVPTCSQYGVQAIEQFGPSKGALLIAWRLLRCSPVGGKGYDPPKWPPVSYTYSSY